MSELKVPKKVKPVRAKSRARVVVSVVTEQEYTDAQFSADLKKSNKWREQMIAEALEEDAKGETLDFQV